MEQVLVRDSATTNPVDIGDAATNSLRVNVVANGTTAIRFDPVSPTLNYLGMAVIGTASSSALWQLRRISISGTEVIIEWADGNSAFDNIWDNRGSYSYS